jgi:hypothetical protein
LCSTVAVIAQVKGIGGCKTQRNIFHKAYIYTCLMCFKSCQIKLSNTRKNNYYTLSLTVLCELELMTVSGRLLTVIGTSLTVICVKKNRGAEGFVVQNQQWGIPNVTTALFRIIQLSFN